MHNEITDDSVFINWTVWNVYGKDLLTLKIEFIYWSENGKLIENTCKTKKNAYSNYLLFNHLTHRRGKKRNELVQNIFICVTHFNQFKWVWLEKFWCCNEHFINKKIAFFFSNSKIHSMNFYSSGYFFFSIWFGLNRCAMQWTSSIIMEKQMKIDFSISR